ncbi:MAG: ABC transporter permease [Syntrophobacteraceae bacterium]|jgi:NitT/TauT family transport system permease protein|nr:ABC transporter permease [Syntrophobacteraceae bacterium]
MMWVTLWEGTNSVPGLGKILGAFWELTADGTLARYSVASLFRVTVGFYIAILVAVPLGIVLGRMERVNRLVNPVIQFLRPVSPLAWIPFAMLWFGIGDKPALFIIFIGSVFPLLISTVKASASIHPMYFQVAANLQLGLVETVRFLILPAVLPQVVLALRVSLGIAWLVVVAAEMIAVKSGLGYLVIDARNALRLDHVVVAIVTIGAIGLALDSIMTRLERLESLRWRLEQA